MAWSITEVARASGVTPRALRHYHAIGLLEPAWTTGSGRRHYDRPQLLRLQRILLLRTLGLSLGTVAEVLEREHAGDTVEILGRHRDRLCAERDRLARLAHTVEMTMQMIEEGTDMAPEQLFTGFEHDHEVEARRRWGDELVDATQERVAGFTTAEAELARTGFARVWQGLAPLRVAGVPVTDDRVQRWVRLHAEVVALHGVEPSAEMYRGLGRMYVEDARFHPAVGGGDPELVAYLSRAMDRYAQTHLTS